MLFGKKSNKIQEIEEITQDMNFDGFENAKYTEFTTGNGTHQVDITIHIGANNINYLRIEIDGNLETEQEINNGIYPLDENDERYQDANFAIVKLPYFVKDHMNILGFNDGSSLYQVLRSYRAYNIVDPDTLQPNMLNIASLVWRKYFNGINNEFNESNEDEKHGRSILANYYDTDHWTDSQVENEYNSKYKSIIDDMIQREFDGHYTMSCDTLNELIKAIFRNTTVEPLDVYFDQPTYGYDDDNFHFNEKIDGRTVIVVHYNIGRIKNVWLKTTLYDRV